jgi:carnitine O-acetyltransferase
LISLLIPTDWFDVLDSKNRPMMSDREILSNLQGIVADADKLPITETGNNAVGILTTENRKTWAKLRNELRTSNAKALAIVESALFIVCLDDSEPADLGELCGNFLCGGYRLEHGIQVGTCMNRWYDKLQIIVCSNGEAGVNFEHTGVDGHTVLRYAADIYTELVLLYAKSINPSTPSLFKAKLSPFAKGSKTPREADDVECEADTNPKKLPWRLTPNLKAGVRYAETRISDLICQNDSQALEFRGYGANFIKRHGFSPDAFVQMAFQAAYYSLYGRSESTYEPAMTKQFLHGRTEAIRTVTAQSAKFVETFCDEHASAADKMAALREACARHTTLTRECSSGLGQDRHLYAMNSLVRREVCRAEEAGEKPPPVPAIFTDPGYSTLGSSVLSTSNCGNPALRLFGFGPVHPEGYGIGYIIKDEGISVCMSSKHLQTRRLLKTLQAYLMETRAMLIQLWREANTRPEAFVDHSGVMRDARTGRRLSDAEVDGMEDSAIDDEDDGMGGFGYFDVVAPAQKDKRRRRPTIGKMIPIAEY